MIVLARAGAPAPLVVGANRDEAYDRPAEAMTVLSQRPLVLGGRDQLAGGTWLAVGESGVVAGLTNRPMTEGRDPDKRSRGELPLALARHSSARQAVEDFTTRFRPSDYNPAWILVGDRRSLFALDMTEGEAARVQELALGLHILENRPLGAPSAKVDHVRRLLDGVEDQYGEPLERRLRAVLSDHGTPGETGGRPDARVAGPDLAGPDLAGPDLAGPDLASPACVHGDRYGTRWSAIVTVPARDDVAPSIRYADGPPCRSSYREARWP